MRININFYLSSFTIKKTSADPFYSSSVTIYIQNASAGPEYLCFLGGVPSPVCLFYYYVNFKSLKFPGEEGRPRLDPCIKVLTLFSSFSPKQIMINKTALKISYLCQGNVNFFLLIKSYRV